MPAVAQSDSNTAPIRADTPTRELRLLIVDDDATQRRLLARGAAKHAGHAVTEASSCREAIEKIGAHDFDCVTLDLELGDGGGIAVIEALAAARFAGTVILISGMDASCRIAARTHARRKGIAVRGLPKPVDLSALRVCLADIGKTTLGLPSIHSWGGVASETIVDQHRRP